MAGIGFQLKKILEERSLTSVLKTFGYSGILSSGPWVISMVISGWGLDLPIYSFFMRKIVKILC